MPDAERLTVTLPPEVAEAVRDAVAGGAYASSSEVVQEALQDWQARRAAQAALKAEIERGLADLAAGRVQEFDAARIVERGRRPSAPR